jgi:nicotinamide mononucleotide transporter
MQSILQVYYFGMAVYGWLEWQRGGREHSGVQVHWWSPLRHHTVIALVILNSGGFGWVLDQRTDSAMPYLDSFTTVAALVTTFMVARKVIENWLYWFVIDVVLVYMSWQSGLPWTAGLYALYLVMVVIGFVSWLKSSQSRSAEVDATRIA